MKESDKLKLISSMERIVILLEQIDKQIDKLKLKDEQFVLDWYDKINEISVRK